MPMWHHALLEHGIRSTTLHITSRSWTLAVEPQDKGHTANASPCILGVPLGLSCISTTEYMHVEVLWTYDLVNTHFNMSWKTKTDTLILNFEEANSIMNP